MRNLPLLLVISTMISHLACGNTASSGEDTGPNDDAVLKSPPVFASPCNAKAIDVFLDGEYLSSIFPNGIVNPAGGGKDVKEIGMYRCLEYAVPTVEGNSLKDHCKLRASWLDLKSGEDFVKVYIPSGAITTSGTRFITKAVCSGQQSVVVCQDGKCTGPGTSGGDGSPVETGEEGTDSPSRPIEPIRPKIHAVFASPCNADLIEVTRVGASGSLVVTRQRDTIGGAGMAIKNDNDYCNGGKHAVETWPGKSQNDCPIRVRDGRRSEVKVYFPYGIITTRGRDLIATAFCEDGTKMVCQRGRCKSVRPIQPIRPCPPADYITGPAVFASPCDADVIEVHGDIGHVYSIVPDGNDRAIKNIGMTVEYYSNGREVVKKDCSAVHVTYQDGIISTKGSGLTAKAVCRDGTQVECRAGHKCTPFDGGSESPEENEDGITIETDEESTPLPTTESGEESTDETDEDGKDGSSGPIGPVVDPTRPTTVINGDDDRSDTVSHPTTIDDSINGNSKQVESTTQMDEKTSTLTTVAYVVGGILVLAIFVTIIVCLLKKRSSNADEADVEEGDVDIKTEIISETPSEQ